MKNSSTKEYLDNIQEIRTIMEASSRFISLSGLSGVFAGIYALIGAFAAYLYFGRNYYTPDVLYQILDRNGNPTIDFLFFIIIDAGLVFILALSTAVFLTTKKAKKSNQIVWNKPVKKMLISLFIPLITGGIFIFSVLLNGIIYLVAPATLIFYGLALINASKYTLRDIQYLGIFEIILGLTASFIIGYGLLFWAFGFGILHIIYGIIMYFKYDNKK
ncbi:MAG: hypothetical protein Kow0068_05230 [Marinilabiliales bacterium]